MNESEKGLLSIFIHEITNSMSGISSAAEALKLCDGSDEDELAEIGEDIKCSYIRTATLFERLRCALSPERAANSKQKDICDIVSSLVQSIGPTPSTIRVDLSHLKRGHSMPELILAPLLIPILQLTTRQPSGKYLDQQTVFFHTVDDRSIRLQFENTQPLINFSFLSHYLPNIRTKYEFEIGMLQMTASAFQQLPVALKQGEDFIDIRF